MADGPGWSDAQWEKVQNAITEAFNRASVAGSFLPTYGPLGASVESVRKEELSELYQDPLRSDKATLSVTDDETLKLFNLTVNVELSAQQVSDEALSSALLAFRRAANTLALVEDEIVFNGYIKPSLRKALPFLADGVRSAAEDERTELVAVKGPDSSVGLTEAPPTPDLIGQADDPATTHDPTTGQRLVTAVSAAIADLEANSHPGPYACVMASRVFVHAHTPEPRSMVLPADRITPMLGGPLLRSGVMQEDHAIVVSLAEHAIDIVVATPPKAQFLQTTGDAKYIFRVYERFTLRHRDPQDPPVRTFILSDAQGQSRQTPDYKAEIASSTLLSKAQMTALRSNLSKAEARATKLNQDLGKKASEIQRLQRELEAYKKKHPAP